MGPVRRPSCKKHPGHKPFISIQDFKGRYLPCLETDKQREVFGAMIDLTARICGTWISPDRPDNDDLFDCRGTNQFRLATGFIFYVSDPVYNGPCPCEKCDGEVARKHWKFSVEAPQFIVYNTEEAKTTKVDMFFDDENCHRDGRMKTVKALGMEEFKLDSDVCYISCATHDEALGERIESACRLLFECEVNPLDLGLSDPAFLPLCHKGRFPALIVSHPHGLPKKITIGEGSDEEFPIVKYNAATCPGSSGAPVFMFKPNLKGSPYLRWETSVHSGTCTPKSRKHKDLVSYGCFW